MGMDEGMRRLWRKFQIRGIIGKDQPFPLTAEQSEHITPQIMIRAAHDAIDRSPPKEERRHQKQEALREAFASVPLDVRRQIRDVLSPDFALFGYEEQPNAVFPGEASEESDSSFKYFKVY